MVGEARRARDLLKAGLGLGERVENVAPRTPGGLFGEQHAGRLSVTDDVIMEKVQDLVVQIGKGEAPPPEQEAEPAEVQEEAGDEEELPEEAEPAAGAEEEESAEPDQAETEETAAEIAAQAGEQESAEEESADEAV